jgi:hypothetical protein
MRTQGHKPGVNVLTDSLHYFVHPTQTFTILKVFTGAKQLHQLADVTLLKKKQPRSMST